MIEIPLWHNLGSSQSEQLSWSSTQPPFRLVRNVSQPSLSVFLPDPSINTQAAVLICPGGGLHVLAIDHEGFEVAEWLTARGIAAMVLKYRLLETPLDDAESEAYIQHNLADPNIMRHFSTLHQATILADGQQAMRLVREHASIWNIRPDRIGMIGFSAGGFLTASVALVHDVSSRPDFVAPIYAALWEKPQAPPNPMPMFLALASNDSFGQIMIQSSLNLYNAWQQAGVSVELHAYAQGQHGFGMNKQGLPSDYWIERFHEWLESQGLFEVSV